MATRSVTMVMHRFSPTPTQARSLRRPGFDRRVSSSAESQIFISASF
ncbi:hypothetical protein [Streptomyces spiralis]